MLMAGLEQTEPSGQHGSKHEEGASLHPGRGCDGPIHEVLQKIAAQVGMNVIQKILMLL
jgi:hypothetical protein